MLGHQTYSNSILQKPNIIWSWSAHEWELCIKLSHVFGDRNGDTLHLVSGCEWLLYIYTKALADRILSSVQRSKNLRVKPGFPVRIFYLFKMSSKKLISRIYIYTKSLILWTYKLWKYISELFYLLDPCIYIGFSAFSMVYFIRWRMNINKINNFISIYSSKKESSLVSLVCWNILSVGFMYIYIGLLHPPWITDYCIQQRMNF